MFIWDFVASTVLDNIMDWFYGQVVGFLGNFFAEMGNMGVELFQQNWVQSIVLFFSYLAWALYVTGLVVAGFECGIEYNSGRGNFKEMALNAIKGFLAVSLFTVVPVRLYELSVTLQSSLTAGITGYGTSIGDAAGEIINTLNGTGSLTEMTSSSMFGFASITSPIVRTTAAVRVTSWKRPWSFTSATSMRRRRMTTFRICSAKHWMPNWACWVTGLVECCSS